MKTESVNGKPVVNGVAGAKDMSNSGNSVRLFLDENILSSYDL